MKVNGELYSSENGQQVSLIKGPNKQIEVSDSEDSSSEDEDVAPNDCTCYRSKVATTSKFEQMYVFEKSAVPVVCAAC